MYLTYVVTLVVLPVPSIYGRMGSRSPLRRRRGISTLSRSAPSGLIAVLDSRQGATITARGASSVVRPAVA